MENKTWTRVDKTRWARGPWDDEPDKEQWQDPGTGLPCLIKRNMDGVLCGYVGVTEGHPWFGQKPFDVDASIGASIDYGDFCQEGPEAETICHIPAPGEPERVWWLGFHCGHARDVSPAVSSLEPIRIPGASYKTVAYVKALCTSLAAEAATAVSPAQPPHV